MRVAVCIYRFAPYHIARLNGCEGLLNVVGVEYSRDTEFYEWDHQLYAQKFDRVTVYPDGDLRREKVKEQRSMIRSMLNSLDVEVVAVNGWSTVQALITLEWALDSALPVIMMSESNRFDSPRNFFFERAKKMICSAADSALVGGQSHGEYLQDLGFKKEAIFFGYNVVDNKYFELTSDFRRNCVLVEDPKPFILCSCRFIEKKNIPWMLREYKQYLQSTPGLDLDLVILGGGSSAAEKQIRDLITELGLRGRVHLPGFIQYQELPNYYARASVFVHASTSEQWGLVVNEAMASGLPIIVSRHCGAACLVQNGVNGFVFDPTKEGALAESLLLFDQLAEEHTSMGVHSREIISQNAPEHFGTGLYSAAKFAIDNYKKRPVSLARLLIKVLSMR